MITLKRTEDEGYCNYCSNRTSAAEISSDTATPRPVDRLCEECLEELYDQIDKVFGKRI